MVETTKDNQFGENLRTVIKSRGLTYSSAAAQIEISLSFLNQLMRGESRPSLEMIYQISEKLDVSAGALLESPSRADLLFAIIPILCSLDENQLRQVLSTATRLSTGPSASRTDLLSRNKKSE